MCENNRQSVYGLIRVNVREHKIATRTNITAALSFKIFRRKNLLVLCLHDTLNRTVARKILKSLLL